jgi:hypothetical protein
MLMPRIIGVEARNNINVEVIISIEHNVKIIYNVEG